jgi:hypothetical protein
VVIRTHDRYRAGELQAGGSLAAEAPSLLRRLVLPAEARAAGLDARAFVDAKPPDAPVFVEKAPEDLQVPLPIGPVLTEICLCLTPALIKK